MKYHPFIVHSCTYHPSFIHLHVHPLLGKPEAHTSTHYHILTHSLLSSLYTTYSTNKTSPASGTICPLRAKAQSGFFSDNSMHSILPDYGTALCCRKSTYTRSSLSRSQSPLCDIRMLNLEAPGMERPEAQAGLRITQTNPLGEQGPERQRALAQRHPLSHTYLPCCQDYDLENSPHQGPCVCE